MAEKQQTECHVADDVRRVQNAVFETPTCCFWYLGVEIAHTSDVSHKLNVSTARIDLQLWTLILRATRSFNYTHNRQRAYDHIDAAQIGADADGRRVNQRSFIDLKLIHQFNEHVRLQESAQ